MRESLLRRVISAVEWCWEVAGFHSPGVFPLLRAVPDERRAEADVSGFKAQWTKQRHLLSRELRGYEETQENRAVAAGCLGSRRDWKRFQLEEVLQPSPCRHRKERWMGLLLFGLLLHVRHFTNSRNNWLVL